MPRSKEQKIRTLFGKYILPPWRASKLKAGAHVLEFCLYTNHFPSSKNRKKPWINFEESSKLVKECIKTKGHITLSDYNKIKKKYWLTFKDSDENRDFVKEMKPELQEQMLVYSKRFGEKGLIFPITKAHIDLKFYCKHNYLMDSINKEEAILDLLVKAGTISDDNRFVLPKRTIDARSYKDEILNDIVVVAISLNLKNE